MPREFLHAVDDILEAISGIESATAARDFEAYQSDWVLRHAIERGVEIISEASRSIPADAQALRPEIPWPKLRDIGNVLRHRYHRLSGRIIWNLVIDELPRIRTAVEARHCGIAPLRRRRRFAFATGASRFGEQQPTARSWSLMR